MAEKKSRRQEVRGILAQLEQSGLSQKEFAQREGISTSTLQYWLRRERLEREIAGETTLVAVTAAPSLSTLGFIIEFGDFRIEVPRDASVDEWQRLREAWVS
jgi:transcriptional regulator with XRE-family HTH domain